MRQGLPGRDHRLLRRFVLIRLPLVLRSPVLTSSPRVCSASAEFIHLISSEANDACEKDSKKTIAPEHVVAALKALGFDDYVEEVEGVLDEHKEHVKVSPAPFNSMIMSLEGLRT